MSSINGKGPRGRKKAMTIGEQILTEIPQEQVSFDKGAFDEMIRSQGLRFTHFRAVPDVSGQASRGDQHDVLGKRQSIDGFKYIEAGCFTGWMQANSTDLTIEDEGVLSSSTAYLTLPTTYDDGTTPLLVSDWDRFFLKDVEMRVVALQKFEASPTGIDRMNFPVSCVEFLYDSTDKEYKENIDFVITPEGDVRWISQNRPGINPVTGRGIVCSIRYRYTGFYVVSKILHEMRAAQVTDPATYERSVERMPYQVLIAREKVFHDQARTPYDVLQSKRAAYSSPSGGTLGPK
jgi:hypothetical protein